MKDLKPILVHGGLLAALVLWLAACRSDPAEEPLSAPSARDIVLSSEVLGRDMPARVLLPAAYQSDTGRRFPVLYLLHGHGGDYTNWSERIPELGTWASESGFLLVCPDGLRDSWYLDSPVDTSSQMLSFLAEELIPFIDAHFRTRPGRAYRGVSGLSMGGHGALWLALQRPELFGAAGSLSGVMDLSRYPDRYGLREVLGPYRADRYRAHSVLFRAEQLRTSSLALYFDCGLSDPFFPENLELHQHLRRAGIPHTFRAAPGAHHWAYWRAALPYQFLFFETYFQ